MKNNWRQSVREQLESFIAGAKQDDKIGCQMCFADNQVAPADDWSFQAPVKKASWEGQSYLVLAYIVRKDKRDNYIRVPNPQSSGFLRAFMEEFEAAAYRSKMGVFVDNVVTEWLPKKFIRRGYVKTRHTTYRGIIVRERPGLPLAHGSFYLSIPALARKAAERQNPAR